MTKEEAKQKVAGLVAKYEGLTPSTLRTFNEANTKQGFIEPLFKALGWNVDDTHEVMLEEKASGGRVDYAFKLNGVSQFYLEAKPLRADLTNATYIKQAVTYAYGRGVTWAVLSDFARSVVYVAQTGQPFINLSCDKYLTDFDDLWLLSKESFQKNALTERAEKYSRLPIRIGIEEKLFGQLRQWRGGLFNQLPIYNERLTFRQADEVIQKLFDRLIFIRTCEDRRIEDYRLRSMVNQWKSSGRRGELVEELQGLFREFDGYYDSDLFAQHMVDEVFIMGTTLESVIEGLYEIPGGLASYDFSIIDADVLGAVYEQYLGYVGEIEKQRAKEAQAKLDLGIQTESISLVQKKQRRKEQGIYYTPKFVTDYIVRETVGRFLSEHSPTEIRNIKILDPACGSGSFLIRAFDELLKYYASQKVSKSEDDIDAADRISILKSNVFGVDLDEQAVEIARLNLLLRSLAKREPLPNLKDNIRQGNSLISGSEEELKGYFGDGWREKKPFNWEDEFRDIMANGGFDVVIGNPPYIRIQALPRDEADYYREIYESAFGSFDIYVLFIEKAINLLNPGGRMGFITSGKFLKSEYGKRLREIIKENCVVESLVDLSAQQVFGEATTYPAIIILRKAGEDAPLHYTHAPAETDLTKVPLAGIPPITVEQTAIVKGIWPPIAKTDTLMNKLTRNTVPLGELADRVFVGLQTSADKVYILENRGESDNGMIKVYSRSLDKIIELESVLLKPLISGKDVERFVFPLPTHVLLFPYKVSGDTAELIPEEEFSSLYPRCWEYLLENRTNLESRENGKMKHEKWYAFGRTQNLAMHDKLKFAIPRLVHRLEAVLDRGGQFYLDNVDVGGLTLKNTSNDVYVLGLLNSSLLNYYFNRVSVAFRGGFRSANRQYLEPLPIHIVDFSNPAEKSIHDRLVALVERMLELNKRLAPVRDTYGNERDELLREIEKTDREIDSLVYDLYGLTEEERRIVEGESKK